jgi:hypothetical protein
MSFFRSMVCKRAGIAESEAVYDDMELVGQESTSSNFTRVFWFT